jgi:hypothetical protein
LQERRVYPPYLDKSTALKERGAGETGKPLVNDGSSKLWGFCLNFGVGQQLQVRNMPELIRG